MISEILFGELFSILRSPVAETHRKLLSLFSDVLILCTPQATKSTVRESQTQMTELGSAVDPYRYTDRTRSSRDEARVPKEGGGGPQ